jgi:NAD(P)-dependent dehydrogenase (short-subunit alcohol dehydrogenase family)
MNGRLKGKRALITGAASGIGLATARRFAAEGARVGVVDIDGPGVEAAASVIESTGGEALRLVADVTDESAMQAAFEIAVGHWGALDVVVANAGIEMVDRDTKVGDLDAEVWQRIIGVNLTGQFLTCKHGVRALQKAGGGSLICTASPCGVAGLCAPETAYSASKGGVVALIRVMAADYAPEGIRVNGVVPGFIDTPMTASFTADPVQLEEWTSVIPIRRVGQAEEVANMMLFLASDESSYAIGGLFTVDGGHTAI